MKLEASLLVTSFTHKAGSLKLELAKTHRAIANGLYGQRLTDAQNKVRDLETQLLAMGVRP